MYPLQVNSQHNPLQLTSAVAGHDALVCAAHERVALSKGDCAAIERTLELLTTTSTTTNYNYDYYYIDYYDNYCYNDDGEAGGCEGVRGSGKSGGCGGGEGGGGATEGDEGGRGRGWR